jgi:hypothetical protein
MNDYTITLKKFLGKEKYEELVDYNLKIFKINLEILELIKLQR